MNIFKVLANGHGSVNENNISAFLGYLLDPNANHALGYEFLKAFVEELNIDDDENDEFNIEKCDINVYYEQKYKGSKSDTEKAKSEVVDIVIMCSRIVEVKSTSTQMLNDIKSIRKIEKVFLIENKIKTSSITKGQILRQADAFKNEIESLELDEKIDVYSIYITPDDEKVKKEFKDAKKELDNSKHLFWKSNDETKVSIQKLLTNLIYKDENSLIDPINDYTKYTTKAFIQFIDSGFKSEVEEENSKKFSKNISYDISAFSEDMKEYLNLEDSQLVIEFTNFIKENFNSDIICRHSKTHPCTVLFKGKKIFSLTKSGKSVILHFLFRNYDELNADLIKNMFNPELYKVSDNGKLVSVYTFNKSITNLSHIFKLYISPLIKN